MTLEDLRTASWEQLIIYADNANNKSVLNSIIYELVCRTYVPFSGVNFDDLLLQYGYQPSKKEKTKVLTK